MPFKKMTEESTLLESEIILDQDKYRIFEYVTKEHLEDLNNELNYHIETENLTDGTDSVLGRTTDVTNHLKKSKAARMASVDTFWSKILCTKWNDFVCQLGNTDPFYTITEKGGYYRCHFDHPQNGHFSNTLFLNDPDEYEGGELELLVDGEVKRFKLPAGQVVTYETGLPHQVLEVTKGVRKVLVWWTTSVIPKKSDLYAWRTLKSLLYYEDGTFGSYPRSMEDVSTDLYEFVKKPHCIYIQASNNILRNHLTHRTGNTGI